MGQFKQPVRSAKNFFPRLYRLIMPGKQNDTLRTHLTRGAMGSFILKITSTALALLISALLARTLGAEGYGYYAYAMAIVGLLLVPIQKSLQTLTIRQSAAYKTRARWGLLRGLLRRANQAIILVALVLIAVSILIAWNFSAFIPSLSFSVFCIALMLLPLTAMSTLRGAALRGLNKVLLGQLPDYIIRQGTFILLIVIFVFLLGTDKFNSSHAMWLQATAALIAFIAGTVLLSIYLPQPIKETTAEYDTRAWIKSALPLLVVGGMQVINKRTDILMLGVLTNSETVGVYHVVIRGAELIEFSLFAVNMTLGPVLSRLFVNNEIKKIQQIILISNGIILIFSLPVTIIFAIFGPWLLSTIFGTEFVIGAAALAILSTGQLVNVATGSAALLLNMSGHEKDCAKGASVTAFINIILNILLIPKWGINGAAIATSISIITWNLIVSIYAYRRLFIYPNFLVFIAMHFIYFIKNTRSNKTY